MSAKERLKRVELFRRDVFYNDSVCDFGKLAVAIDLSRGGYALRAPINEGARVGEDYEPHAGDFCYYVDFALQDIPKEGSNEAALRKRNPREWIKTNALSYHGARVKCRAVFDAALYPAAPPMCEFRGVPPNEERKEAHGTHTKSETHKETISAHPCPLLRSSLLARACATDVGCVTSGVIHVDLRGDGQLSQRAWAVLFGGEDEKRHTVERVHDKLYAFFCGPVHPSGICDESFQAVRGTNRHRQRWSLGYRVGRRCHPELFKRRRDHRLFPEFQGRNDRPANDVEGLDRRFYSMLCAFQRARESAGLRIEEESDRMAYEMPWSGYEQRYLAGHYGRTDYGTNLAPDRTPYLSREHKRRRRQQLNRLEGEGLSQRTRRKLGGSFFVFVFGWSPLLSPFLLCLPLFPKLMQNARAFLCLYRGFALLQNLIQSTLSYVVA